MSFNRKNHNNRSVLSDYSDSKHSLRKGRAGKGINRGEFGSETKVRQADLQKLKIEESLKNALEDETLENEFKNLQKLNKQKQKISTNVIDWKESELYKSVKENTIKVFNFKKDSNYFTEKELDTVLEMIQENGIADEELIKPFFFKSSVTLMKLIEYCGLSQTKYYDSVMDLYTDRNIENTLKLLIRSKQL